MFRELNQDPVNSVLVSPDQEQDPAFVQHCNDKTVTPLMRQLGVDGDETFTIPHVDSEGCPDQFDLTAQYRRISTQQNKTGIQMDWSLNCSCHTKRPSDGIGADVKGNIHAEQMLDAHDRPTRVEDCKRVFDVLQCKLLFRRMPIGDKKGLRGVTRRFAFFVPNHGPDAVRRPVLGCHTPAKCLQTLCKRLQSACKPTL